MQAASARTALNPGRTSPSADRHGSHEAGNPRKSKATAYVLLLSFGMVGAHKFYLGRPSLGALYAAGWVGFWVLFMSNAGPILGFLLLFLVFFAMTWDAMTMSAQVRDANAHVAGEPRQSVLSGPAFFIARDEPFDHRSADAAIARFLEMSNGPEEQARRPVTVERRTFGRRS